MDSYISKLAELISAGSRIVFFGGAGVSTESGIPDFRSEDGVFSAIRKYGYPPEELLSHSFFARKPDIFFRYYMPSRMTHILRLPSLSKWESSPLLLLKISTDFIRKPGAKTYLSCMARYTGTIA